MSDEVSVQEPLEMQDFSEVTQQITELVEVMKAEQELKAEEQALLTEQEEQQAEVQELEVTQEEEFRQALLESLNEVNSNLEDNETHLIEIKEIQQNTYQLQSDMSGHLVYGADSLIIYACLIPLLFIVKVLARLFNRFL